MSSNFYCRRWYRHRMNAIDSTKLKMGSKSNAQFLNGSHERVAHHLQNTKRCCSVSSFWLQLSEVFETFLSTFSQKRFKFKYSLHLKHAFRMHNTSIPNSIRFDGGYYFCICLLIIISINSPSCPC